MAMKAMKAAKADAPPLPARHWKAIKAMNMPNKSMNASKNASMKVVGKASKTGALTNYWHVDTNNVEEIWVDAILINERPPLKSDNIIFNIFNMD